MAENIFKSKDCTEFLLNCKTLPFHLPEAECHIFTRLLVGYSRLRFLNSKLIAQAMVQSLYSHESCLQDIETSFTESVTKATVVVKVVF